APLQHPAQERLLLLQALLSLWESLGYPHLGVARLPLPDNGREAKYGELPRPALALWLVCTCFFPVVSFFFFFLLPAFQYQCLVEGCTEKFKSSKDRKDHLVTVHLYPVDFRFDRPKKVKCGSKHTSSPVEQGASVPMDVSVEMAEQFQVNPVETGPEENMEISQPAASPGPSLPEKRLYKSRSVLWPAPPVPRSSPPAS
uniref:Zinc finger protein 511 n=1 Tax=Ficedula albicollis TaxID=59894 RepID=A0A803VD85_FICAL